MSRAKPIIAFAAVAAAAVFCLRWATPHETQQYAALTRIDLDEPVGATLFGDVDGDGKKDLVLLAGKKVLVFKLRADLAYAGKPDAIVRLPADAVAVDLAALEPGAKAELLVAGPRGLERCDLASNATFRPIALPALDRPLIPLAAGADPVAVPLAAELFGDAAPELLLPLAGGVAVLTSSGGAWRSLGTAEAQVSVRVESGEDRPGSLVRQSFELPRVSIVDVKKPGGPAEKLLAVSRDADCWVYRVADAGLSLVEHARGLFHFDAEDKLKDLRGTRRNEEINDRSVGLIPVDLDGDGIPDFVSSRFRAGQVFLTFGRAGSFVAVEPDRVIDADGWVVLAQPRDIDGDGAPDLVVPRLPKLGISGAIKALLQRRIDLELWVYKNRGGAELLRSEPDWKAAFDVEVLLGGDEGRFNASARIVAAFVDVNGDGRRDFVTVRDHTQLSVHLGGGPSMFSAEPGIKITVPAIDAWPEVDLRSEDVNGDGREDLLLLYGSNKKGSKNTIFFCCWNGPQQK
jgi:hypothetical protein